MRRCALAGAILASVVAAAGAQDRRFKRSDSDRPYTHHVTLRDASGSVIDPTSEDAPPYSPRATCGKCHDVSLIEKGFHFTTRPESSGRPGEPWILVDRRTATWLPISPRAWPGTSRPKDADITGVRFARRFAAHMPGGTATRGDDAGTEDRRWRLTGELEVDCLQCHVRDGSWSHEEWARAIDAQAFAWAPTAAAGLAIVEGSVRGLPDDLDPAKPENRARLPRVRYAAERFAPDGTVFLDLVRTPPDTACLTCHTERGGPGSPPHWQSDPDVHERAGVRCADCHRNGLDHETIRGHPDEVHPAGAAAREFTCGGCHLPGPRGGRLGAPITEHRGLPPVHLERLACTACHAGPSADGSPQRTRTARAHRLGIASQNRTEEDPPAIVAGLLRPDPSGRLTPHRVLWPAYWARDDGAALEPIPPAETWRVLRRALRIRRDLAAERGSDAKAAIAKGLTALAREDAPPPVYVACGRVHRLDARGALVSESDRRAAPYTWPLAHPVRPARRALGAGGCTDCHAATAPIFRATIAPAGPLELPGAAPLRVAGDLHLGRELNAIWNRTFVGRTTAKWVLTISWTLLALTFVAQLGGRVWRRRRGRRIGTVALILATGVLAATGAAGWLRSDALAGMPLLVHVLIGVAFLPLCWFAVVTRGRSDLIALACSAAALACGLPVILLMSGALDSTAQTTAVTFHRIAALAFVAVLAVSLIQGRRRHSGEK